MFDIIIPKSVMSVFFFEAGNFPHSYDVILWFKLDKYAMQLMLKIKADKILKWILKLVQMAFLHWDIEFFEWASEKAHINYLLKAYLTHFPKSPS